jgi:tetratricopeptide (TPR) repeat protein
MSNTLFQNFKITSVLCLAVMLYASRLGAGNTVAIPPVDAATKSEASASSNDAARIYLQIQEQIHATQLAIEQNREAAELAAAQNAEALSNRLQALEQSMTAQRTNELEAMQSTNRLMLLVLGLVAVVGFMAVLLAAYFQWRAIHRLGQISAAWPSANGLGALAEVSTMGLTERQLSNGAVEQSNNRLLGMIDHLEKRIAEMEQAARPALPEPAALVAHESFSAMPDPADAPAPEKSAQIALLLDKGQTLLNQEQAEEAIACFNDVLMVEPNNTEALVKKGAALEKLRKLDEAIVCYDQAIAADSSMTIAYLQKGGLCNRLERFSEAMECYEQALRTQEKKRAA